jgi:peptide deformylase
MKIVQAPNTVLSTIAKPVGKIDKDLKNLLKGMEEALASAIDPEGVGLAAPQIGKSLQIFIVKESPDAKLKTFINPKIISFKDKSEKKIKARNQNAKDQEPRTKNQEPNKGVQLEGCLSLKDIWGVVKRHDEVTISYIDEKGQSHEKTFDGFFATIVQHEIDHLNGILFPKRVLEQKQKLYKSVKNKKGETEFEELEI